MQQNYLLNQRGNIFKVINKGIGIINAVQLVFSAKAYFKACYGNAYNLEAIVFIVNYYSTIMYILLYQMVIYIEKTWLTNI